LGLTVSADDAAAEARAETAIAATSSRHPAAPAGREHLHDAVGLVPASDHHRAVRCRLCVPRGRQPGGSRDHALLPVRGAGEPVPAASHDDAREHSL